MNVINKYNTAMIYSIRSPHTNKYYIGSTTQKLCKRFGDHNVNYARYLKGTGGFTTSFKILELGDAYIELLEEINCENKNQLVKMEGEAIRKHKASCVNKKIEGRTKKEYRIDNEDKIKQFRIDNKDKITENNKQYRINNKDKVIQYRIDNKDKILEKIKQYNNNNKEHKKEYDKQRRIDNKESISKQHKQYYINNIERIKAKTSLLYLCACGSTITHCSKARHNKTAKHLKALEQEIIII